MIILKYLISDIHIVEVIIYFIILCGAEYKETSKVYILYFAD